MMQDQLGKSFGLIIGFLIPGMIGLYGASLHVEIFREWFGIAANAESPTVGGFLFVVVASIGMGVFISNLRWLVLERWIWRRRPPDHDASGRRKTQTELVYQNLVWQFYQFYLFAANTMFALVLLYVAWLAAELASAGFRRGLFLPVSFLIPASYVLYENAKESLKRYNDRRSNVLQMVPTQEKESA